MLTQEHAQTALDYLQKADRHYAEGDQMQASEKLWGAASHALMAVALERGWPQTSHAATKQAAERLADELDDPLIASNFGVAEKFHRDFYHWFMEDHEWRTDRPKISDLVSRVLATLPDAGQGG